MALQVVFEAEGFATDAARVWFGTSVHAHVKAKVTFRAERLSTDGASTITVTS